MKLLFSTKVLEFSIKKPYVKFCLIMQHKNQSELEFPYRFPLQDPCCDSGHPEASIMSAEFASIFAE